MSERLEQCVNRRKVEEESGGGNVATEVKSVEVEPAEVFRAVVLTDSNGRDIRPDDIKAHIPKDRRGRYNIRVVVAYTLMEVWDKLERGVLKVEGETVILNVGTNDVRGTKRVPQSCPDDVGWRFERVGGFLFEKGAVGLVACELKPMSFMDVVPYSWAIHHACLRLRTRGHRVHGVQTQTGVSHLREEDGYHIERSFSTILDRTYACAIRGIPVPCPTPTWDMGRDPGLRNRWPTPREAQDQGNSHRLG